MESNFNASNTGVVAIDPKTGQILTMVGSSDYFNNAIDGQVNVTIALPPTGLDIQAVRLRDSVRGRLHAGHRRLRPADAILHALLAARM